MHRAQKPADRIFEKHGVPQPSHLGSDSLDFSALTTFNREAVLSKFLPSFDDFGRRPAAPAGGSRDRAAAAATLEAAAAAAAAATTQPLSATKQSRAAIASQNEDRIHQATRQRTSADRLQQYRQRAREEQRRNRTARREQSKLDSLWDAASRVVRHRRKQSPYPDMPGTAAQENRRRRAVAGSASRTEGKRRATSALIADPPLSLIKEGLEAGCVDVIVFALVARPCCFGSLLSPCPCFVPALFDLLLCGDTGSISRIVYATGTPTSWTRSLPQFLKHSCSSCEVYSLLKTTTAMA